MMTLLYFFRPKVAIYVQRAECTTHAGLVAQVWDHTIDTPHCLVALLIVNKAWAALTRIYFGAISLIIYARRAETVGSSAIPGSLQPRSWIRRRASAAPAQTVRRPCSRRHVARQPADQKCNFAPAPAKPVSVAVPVPAPVAVPVPVPAKPVPVAVAVPVPVAVAVPVHLLNLSLNQ